MSNRQRDPNSCRIAALATGLLVGTSLIAIESATANPLTTFEGSATGIFSAPTFTDPTTGISSGVGTNSFSWGSGEPSRLDFTGSSFTVTTATRYVFGSQAQAARPFFSLGELSFHNGRIVDGTEARSVRLETSIQLNSPLAAGPAIIPAELRLFNTANTDGQGNPLPPDLAADVVGLGQRFAPVKLTAIGSAPITLQPAGFGDVIGAGFASVDKFFVFEGGDASTDLVAQFGSPCEAIVGGQVKLAASGEEMSATFTPNFGLSIAAAATLCGYHHFNWYQVITRDPFASTFSAQSAPNTPLTVPYVDPPPGGYFGKPADDSLPFYWDESTNELSQNTTSKTLEFRDFPMEPRLTPGQSLEFTTALVGVLPDNSWDALFTWNWSSNFNGTIGGVAVRNNTLPPDPDSGTGGTTILQTDLTAGDLAQQVRDLMQRDGALNVSLDVTAVPEPPMPALLGLTLAAMILGCRRKWRVSLGSDLAM